MSQPFEIAGDTYFNRYSRDSNYSGNDGYKKLPKRCAICGTTKGQLDIDHKDGNRKNNNRSNLRVLCRSCHRSRHDGKGGQNAEIDTYPVEIISEAARIIDDPETEASQAIAASHKNSDLMHVEFILCHANVNKNRDEFTSDDMKENYMTAINKPINWEHTNFNIGTIYESKFVSVADISESDKEYYGKIDSLKEDFIVCRAAIWEYKHPDQAREMRKRNEKGKLFFSMENKFSKAKCSICKEEYSKFFEYCDHLLTRRKTATASRIFLGSNYVGAAITGNPADEESGTLALAREEIDYDLVDNFAFAKEDLFAYVTGETNMRKLNIPDKFSSKAEFLGDEAFADNINRVFPLDTKESVIESIKLFIQPEVDWYSTSEKIYLLDRFSKAAQTNEIDIKPYLVNSGGIEEMSIDVNSPEFQKALNEAVSTKMKEIDSGKALEDARAEVEEARKEATAKEAAIAKEKEEREKAENELKEYKLSIAKQEAAQARVDELIEKGFEFKENLETVGNAVANMNDNSFKAFIDILTEVSSAAKTKFDEEKKKKEEEDKKKEKKPFGKANVDPVKETELAIANKVDGDITPTESAIDLCLKSTLGL